MPYIGYNVIGSTLLSFAASRAFLFTAPENGTVNGIEVYVASTSTGQVRCALYDASASATTPAGNALLGDSGQTGATGAGWAPCLLSTSVALVAGAQYWVTIEGDGQGNLRGDTGATSDFSVRKVGDASDDGVAWPDPCPDRTWVSSANTASLRIAYTAAPTNTAPTTPTISVGDITPTGATLTGSAFSDSDSGDSQSASQWQVTTAADTNFASPVLSTGDDASNLTSYAATGLTASTSYLARVRYKDTNGPAYSGWSTAAPFTTSAPNAPPVVTISSPSAASVTVPAGTKIVLEFTASDPEDGDLTASAVVTSSNTADGTSGVLGTGSPLTLDTTGWANGARTITVTATDSGSLPDSAFFVLTIGAAAGVFIPEEPMQVPIQGGVATVVPVPIWDPVTGEELDSNPFAPGDAKISIDGGAAVVLTDNANAASWPCINSRVYVPISAAQATGKWIALRIKDQDATRTYKCPPVDLIVVDYDPSTATTAPGIASLILADPDVPIANDATGAVPISTASTTGVAGAVRTELTPELANMDAAVSTRLPASSYTAPDNSGIASANTTLATVATDAAAAKTAAQGAATPADVPTAAQNAAAVRDVFGLASSVSDAAPTTTSFIGATGLSAVDDFYKGMFLVFDGGTLDGVGQKVTGYVGSTRTFTVAPAFPATPADGDPFLLIGRG